jgi:hypothetical protein
MMRTAESIMRTASFVAALICLLPVPSLAQQPPSAPDKSPQDCSGMYSFLRDGEFVQITVEDGGHVTGFVSRYGDLESDKDAFLDHFFKDGKLDGNKLTFSTETVHGVWFEFSGTVNRGSGKQPGEEAYYVINGTLVEHITDADKKVASRSREVALKSFPQEMAPSPPKRN